MAEIVFFRTPFAYYAVCECLLLFYVLRLNLLRRNIEKHYLACGLLAYTSNYMFWEKKYFLRPIYRRLKLNG
jgi:hypothetical protein